MSVRIHLQRLIAIGGAAALLSACSTPKVDDYIDDRSVDYKQSREASPLEIPPDLTRTTIDDAMVVPDITPSATATYSDYQGERLGGAVRGETVLPEVAEIEVKRDGNKRWLVIQGAPEAVWPKMREFWLSNGWLVKLEDPRVGVLETDWAENRADIPQDVIRGFFSSVLDSLYSAATRDKYRVRLEHGAQPGTTELYLTHRGAEEVSKGETTIWQARPNDPELEAEMLRRMMVYFGVEGDSAKRQLTRVENGKSRARMLNSSGGVSALQLEEGFNRAWRRTGIALDRVGFTVEDRNRAGGVYFVRYNDPLKEEKEKQGWLDKLAFWSSDEPSETVLYQITLVSRGEQTRIMVNDRDGRPDPSATARRILTLLHEQLK